MTTDFKVYKRKIHVYKSTGAYMWSSHAYPTCKTAVAAAQALHPNFKFTANFESTE